MLVDGVVVARALDAVEHGELGAEAAVVVRDPEVASLPERRAPAVLDQEGAGTRRASQEAARRIGVVPSHDADVVVELGVARVVGARRGVVVGVLVGHRRVHAAVLHDRPLDRRVLLGAAAARQEEHLLDVAHGAQALGRVPRTRVRVVALEDRPLPPGDVGGRDVAGGASLEAQARRLEVRQVVLREIEAVLGQEVRLERPHGGEDPAGAVVVLLADVGHPSAVAQVVARRERAPGPGSGGGRRRQRRRRDQECAQDREECPASPR